MAKFMFRAEVTAQALKGVISEGVAARAAHAKEITEKLGGSFEGYYLVTGAGNVTVMFVELPDVDRAAALALAVSASGAGSVRYEQLLAPEDIQRSIELLPSYRVPGSKVVFDPWA